MLGQDKQRQTDRLVLQCALLNIQCIGLRNQCTGLGDIAGKTPHNEVELKKRKASMGVEETYVFNVLRTSLGPPSGPNLPGQLDLGGTSKVSWSVANLQTWFGLGRQTVSSLNREIKIRIKMGLRRRMASCRRGRAEESVIVPTSSH